MGDEEMSARGARVPLWAMVVLVCLLLWAWGVASAEDYYVNDAATTNDGYCTAVGNDANDGLSPATPKATLQAILDAHDLGPGDTVWVDTGDYGLTTHVTIGEADEGSAAGVVRIVGSPHPDGTELDRGNTGTGTQVVLLDDCDYVTLERLRLTGANRGIYFSSANHCTLSRAVVHGNAGVGVRAFRSDAATVAHCVVRDNGDHGLNLGDCPQADIRNNSVARNGGMDDYQCKLTESSATLASNILWANGTFRYCIYTSGTTLTSDHNDLYATGGARVGYYNGTVATTLAQWQAASGQDANSLSEDPLFADAPGGDFHLQSNGGRYDPTTGKLPADPTAWVDDAASSGCVDAGNPAGDYSQEPQPNGLRINIGAYGGTDEASRMPTTQYYVNDGSTTHDQYCTAPGHNNNDGLTPATPKASLGAILSTYDLEPGDVVWVDTGTYNPSANITIGGDDEGSAAGTLRIVGSPHPDGTVIQRGSTVTGSYGVELDKCNYVSLERLAVTGAYYGIYAHGDADCSVSRCTVFGNASEGVYATYSAFFTVVNTVVHDNGGYGVRLNSSSAVAVHNCSIARNDDDGVYLFDSSLSLRNSIVWADGATVYAVRRLSGSVTSDYNDLYATNGAGVGYFAGTQATLADWQTASGQDPNSLSVDPRFADAPQGDLHLVSEAGRYDPSTGLLPGEPGAWVTDAEQSPCIDAADFALPVGDEPAPNGWRANLGAYGTTDEASKISLPLALPGPLDLDTRVEVNGRRNPDGPAAKSVGVRGIDPGANGPGTRFAIKIGAGAGGWLVFGVGDAAGDLVPTGGKPLWRTADQWRDLRLRHLTPDTDYDFYAKAKNQAGQETDPTQVASHRTNRLGDVDNSESATALDYACVKDAILRGILSWPCDLDDSRSIGADDLDITASAIPLP